MSEGQIIGFAILGTIMAFLYIGEYLLKNMNKEKQRSFQRERTHPAEFLLNDYLLAKFAQEIDEELIVIENLINKKTSVTPTLAKKFAHYFNNDASFWLNAQKSYDDSKKEHK